jgi:hypothetical protein
MGKETNLFEFGGKRPCKLSELSLVTQLVLVNLSKMPKPATVDG